MLATHRRAISLASLALVASGASAAPIVNGGFETGDFSGWAGNGWAVVDSSVGSPMLGGKYSALIVSEGGCRSDLSDFWGCTTPPIPTQPIQDGPLANPFPPSYLFNYPDLTPFFGQPSLIGQDVLAKSGDRITLDWRWLSNDSLVPELGTDNAMFLLVKGDVFFGANSWKLGTGCTEGGAVTGFRFTSGGCQFQAVIPEDGLWTLYAVVGQGGDSAVSSGILVDNVRLHQVPEPSTLALIGFALAGLAFPRRRKQKSRDCSDQPARVAGLASQSSAPGSRIQ